MTPLDALAGTVCVSLLMVLLIIVIATIIQIRANKQVWDKQIQNHNNAQARQWWSRRK